MRRLICVFLFLFTTTAWSQEEWSVSPHFETQVPIFAGVGVAVNWDQFIDWKLQMGTTPALYTQMIGTVAAEVGENEAYDDVIQDSLSHNWSIKTDLEVGFSRAPNRWYLGVGATRIETHGTSDIPSVLAAATGEDYSNLVNFLVLAGKSTNVNIEGSLVIVDLTLGRHIPLDENWILKANIGVAKIVSVETEVSTELPNFDASQGGQQLLNQTETDLEEILLEYGLSPLLGVSISYQF